VRPVAKGQRPPHGLGEGDPEAEGARRSPTAAAALSLAAEVQPPQVTAPDPRGRAGLESERLREATPRELTLKLVFRPVYPGAVRPELGASVAMALRVAHEHKGGARRPRRSLGQNRRLVSASVQAPQLVGLSHAGEHEPQVRPPARLPQSPDSRQGMALAWAEAFAAAHNDVVNPAVVIIVGREQEGMPMSLERKALGILAGKDGRGVRPAHQRPAQPLADPQGVGERREHGAIEGIAGGGGREGARDLGGLAESASADRR